MSVATHKIPAAASDSPEPVVQRPLSVIFNSIGMELRRIEPGEFLMGSQDGEYFVDERPRHRVRVTRPFFLGVHEVTGPQYRAVTEEDRNRLRDRDQTPIVLVDWFEAVRFCNKLSLEEHLPPYYRINPNASEPEVEVIRTDGPGYRLPSEAEWEYACRAGTTSVYPFEGDENALERSAWFKRNSDEKVHEVGKKLPNAWGLHDMLGNAWEWCQDGYNQAYYQDAPLCDPPGPSSASKRVTRGGSIFDDLWCRSAARQGHPATTRLPWMGFRVAAFLVDTTSHRGDEGPTR